MELAAVRKQLDMIDNQLIDLLSQRMELAEQVAQAKLDTELPIIDRIREQEKLASVSRCAPSRYRREVLETFELLMDLNKTAQLRAIEANAVVSRAADHSIAPGEEEGRHEDGGTEPEVADGRERQKRPYGVLGRSLAHSYTPVIYRELAGLDYRTFEREPHEIEEFVQSGAWEGFNVTIPYKRDLVPFMDELTEVARRMGNINTVTRMADGRLLGDNTDYYGFKVLVESLGLKLAGKKAVVFGGAGGAGTTAMMVLADLGMDAVSIDRSGENTYDDLDRHADAALVVNCTPVGMYPSCPAAPCSIEAFSRLEGLIDIVYNPARTALMMEAEARGIPNAGGLLMLVAQAAQAVERYTGQAVDMGRIRQVTAHLASTEQNIALIGMPGCGKSHVGRLLAQLEGRRHVDIDDEVERECGMPCNRFIETHDEDAFRAVESRVTGRVAAQSGLVISCGGGIVERADNYPLLHQNSRIVMIDRPLDQLDSNGRPITARDGLGAIARRRLPRYRDWADVIVGFRGDAARTACAISRALELGSDTPATAR